MTVLEAVGQVGFWDFVVWACLIAALVTALALYAAGRVVKGRRRDGRDPWRRY